MEALYVHFSSPTTNKQLIDLQNNLGIKKRTLCSISDTRWSCRYKNCKMVMENYSVIIQVLQSEIDSNNDKDCVRAIGKYF